LFGEREKRSGRKRYTSEKRKEKKKRRGGAMEIKI
jgi:hypothetical protein